MANKILIVDDEPFNLDLLEQELQEQGYDIERASDGAEALEKVPLFTPDVVLLDYMMPRMNGLEVLRRLRADDKWKSLPVILLTAKAAQEDKVTGLDAGADDYVIKPFDSFELLARVPGRYTAPASSSYLYYTDEHKSWAPPVEVSIAK